ncbi:ATP synthase subunit O, mitochondrial [Dorcoceras hygrometricum]|uniref:ATP synthase subunit O, mitochondrial n=1 Tax=Dorcoceras hygrometricum TaxID=472368 RepID=A0A2Z7B8R0_9LAMI|nr:ATP synthase subunit O, mitochondrial [Dorcoceras hygrometricum]
MWIPVPGPIPADMGMGIPVPKPIPVGIGMGIPESFGGGMVSISPVCHASTGHSLIHHFSDSSSSNSSRGELTVRSMAGRLRSVFPLLHRTLTSDAKKAFVYPTFANAEFSRNYATTSPAKEQKVKVPVAMYGVSGNYASALYIAAVKANALDKVESELLVLIEASKRSPMFSQFMKDLSVTADIRVKAINDICAQAKFDDITKNFMAVLAEYGRLGHIERIAQRFSELTMAHRGEVKATVTAVIALPPEEEKELKETLQDILGQGKKVKLEQKIDPSILGGLVVEFQQKVFDMSIKTRALQMERFLRQPVNLDGQ